MADQGSSVGFVNQTINFNNQTDFESGFKDPLDLGNSIDFVYANVLNQVELPQAIVTYYVMRAKDPDCGTTTYVTWVVQDSPDTDASEYIGSKCGMNSLEDIIVLFKYSQ